MAVPKVIFPMADYGHDPTETTTPYTAFKKAGFEVYFVTETGKTPQCDQKLIKGLTQKLLGATALVVSQYETMSTSPEFLKPLSWTSPDFSLTPYDLVFLVGGHDKAVRQIYDSPIIAKHLATYFPSTAKPSTKSVAAVCHGVLALAVAKLPDGKSVIHECKTATLPARFEQVAYWGTRLFLGDYYKTYGAGTEDVEVTVRKALDDPETQFKSSLGTGPFVVEDDKYNYISARFPGDAELIARRTILLVKASIASPA